MIRRLQPGYKPVGALHSNEDIKPKIRYCQRCEDFFQVQALLGPRIMPLDEATRKPIPKPHDYDHWLECRNCGTVYPKHETKVEPELRPVIQPGSNKGKLRGIQTKKRKQKGRGNNPRITQR